MTPFIRYAGRAQEWRVQLSGLPDWARVIVAIFAIPGIVLVGLSLLALLVSILALLFLSVPIYLLLKRLAGPVPIAVVDGFERQDVKRVSSTVVE